jgi:hypothetical protein
MTKLPDPRAQEVFKELAASGRYVNTGKVLIGVSHVPRPRQMTQGEELVQEALLGTGRHRVHVLDVAYMTLLAILFATLFISCAS